MIPERSKTVPLYEYQCGKCGSRFEQIVYGDDKPVSCRACGSAGVTRLLSTFSVLGSSDRPRSEPTPCDTCGAAERGTCGMK